MTATEIERQEHDIRISNLRTAIQMAYVGPEKPGELRKLGDAMDAEFALCESLGCNVTAEAVQP